MKQNIDMYLHAFGILPDMYGEDEHYKRELFDAACTKILSNRRLYSRDTVRLARQVRAVLKAEKKDE